MTFKEIILKLYNSNPPLLNKKNIANHIWLTIFVEVSESLSIILQQQNFINNPIGAYTCPLAKILHNSYSESM